MLLSTWRLSGLFGSVKVAKEAMFAPGARCSSGDTVLLKLDGTMHVGKVQVHSNVSGRDFSCVEMWRPMGQNMLEPLKGIKVLLSRMHVCIPFRGMAELQWFRRLAGRCEKRAIDFSPSQPIYTNI